MFLRTFHAPTGNNLIADARVQILQRPISVYCLPTVLPFLTDTVPFFHSFPPLFWVINATSILLVDVLPLPSTTGLIISPQPLLLWFLFSLAALWSSVAPMCSYCECLVPSWRCYSRNLGRWGLAGTSGSLVADLSKLYSFPGSCHLPCNSQPLPHIPSWTELLPTLSNHKADCLKLWVSSFLKLLC